MARSWTRVSRSCRRAQPLFAAGEVFASSGVTASKRVVWHTGFVFLFTVRFASATTKIGAGDCSVGLSSMCRVLPFSRRLAGRVIRNTRSVLLVYLRLMLRLIIEPKFEAAGYTIAVVLRHWVLGVRFSLFFLSLASLHLDSKHQCCSALFKTNVISI